MSPKHESRGFSLVELLLTLVIGCGLSGWLLQTMLAEGRHGQRVGRLWRERVVAQRTLQLVRGDLLQAQGQADLSLLPPACNLAGRTPVLHLATQRSIWRSTSKIQDTLKSKSWPTSLKIRCI